MRSFFKKPSWAQVNKPRQSSEFYRRSDQVYADILAAEHDDGDSDKQRTELIANNAKSNGEQQRKRRRTTTSPEEVDEKVPTDPIAAEAAPQAAAPSLPPRGQEHVPVVAESHKSAHSKEQPYHTAALVDPDSDSSVVEVTSSISRHPPQQAGHQILPDDDTLTEEEEEFAELVRRARMRARKKSPSLSENADYSLQARSSATYSNLNGASTALRKKRCLTSDNPSTPGSETSNHGPVIQILITSPLDNTKPLIVQRRRNQNLGDVRKAWCKRQGFSPEFTANVFLTWKGRRLFDVTTCRGLGIGIKNGTDNDLHSMWDVDDVTNDLRVEMEAITEEIFESRKKQLHAASKEAEDPDVEDEPQEVVLRITLKSPDFTDTKVKVRPSTRVAHIADSFRELRQIPSTSIVQLFFDGDCLRPDSQVGDNEIADLDCIDVRVK